MEGPEGSVVHGLAASAPDFLLRRRASRRDVVRLLGAGLLGLAAGACSSSPTSTTPTSPASSPAAASSPASPSAVAVPSTSPGASAVSSPASSPVAAASAVPSAAPAVVAGSGSLSMKIAYTQPAAAFAGLWTAMDTGLFTKNNLTVEVTRVTPPADIQAVLSGSLDLTVDGSAPVSATAQGAPMKLIASPVPYYTQALYANPSITSVPGLVGKKVGATTQGGSSDNALRTLLTNQSIDPSQVDIIYLRDDFSILASIESGVLDAAILTSPDTLAAAAAGFSLLVDLAPLHLLTINQGVACRTDWAAANTPVLSAFLKAFMEGVANCKSNPDQTKQIISKYSGMTDQASLDASYTTATAGWVIYPAIQDGSVQNVIDMTTEPAVKANPPSYYYDNTYVQALEDYAASLYPNGVITDPH